MIVDKGSLEHRLAQAERECSAKRRARARHLELADRERLGDEVYERIQRRKAERR